MQSGQITNFSQFTSTILHWIEDSCRPSVNKKKESFYQKSEDFYLGYS
jgi:hypothetical protein